MPPHALLYAVALVGYPHRSRQTGGQRIVGVAMRRFSAVISILLVACAPLTPEKRIAKAAGWHSQPMEVDGFTLQVYTSPDLQSRQNEILHIYLGGDGRPWVNGRFPATDPTASNPVVLELMALDPAASLYLGRPCYHAGASMAPCHPSLWTMARYGETVVSTMASGLKQLLLRHRARAVLLVGYSGGGVLAAALAERLALPVFLVTIATNLDVAAWVSHHGYLPLDPGFDPAQSLAALAVLPQLHLQGLRDDVVPPATTVRYTSAMIRSTLRAFPEADHRCCWRTIWADLLEEAPWAAVFPAKGSETQ